MKTIAYTDPNFDRAIAKLNRRAEPDDSVRETVAAIVADVRKRGDRALCDYARKFDGAALKPAGFAVTDAEFAAAEAAVDAETKRALAASHRNVAAFAKKGLRQDWSGKNAQGAEVGEIFRPFERVGVYVPGGSAPLVSTAVMTCAIAQAAGVPEIVACTPCGPDGAINAALLYALRLSGATEVYRLGGAQAVAALALGTKTIRPAAKVFGPGNRFVVEAKRQLVGAVAIDLLPGPSEVLVLADASGDPRFIAADLLAQAEHGGDSQIVFITNSKKLLAGVEREVERQSAELSRQGPIRRVLQKGGTAILVKSLQQGAEIANAYAPEHLSLIARNESAILPLIKTSGAIFLGNYSPVAAGDFLAGPSHTLPTGGAGKSFPGLTADQFQRRTSLVRLDPKSMAKSAPIIAQIAGVEGLDAHARSATIRVG